MGNGEEQTRVGIEPREPARPVRFDLSVLTQTNDLLPCYLNPAIDVIVARAMATVSVRVLTTVIPRTFAAAVPVDPVSSAAAPTTLPPGFTPFLRFPPFHRDPRREALVFPVITLNGKWHGRLVLLGRAMSRVTTVAVRA